ncbi:MAG: hypothetical protein M1816_004466 [Peltula sp. TS41687]|nr:MAG: hypothetical protein M1816_004466 [Peltula sp. TS41687]
MLEHGFARNFLTILRNLALAIVLYGGIFTFIEFIQTGSVNSIAALHPSNLRSHGRESPSKDIVDTLRPIRGGSEAALRGGAVEVRVGNSKKKAIINPHANVFNRPESLVVAKDDYMGPRPHVDTVADLSLLVERCRGSLEGLEKMRHVFECLQFLDKDEKEYYSLPAHGNRASDKDPQKSEYALPADHDYRLKSYVSPSDAIPASNSSIGNCAGPVIPYHVYWTGPATWRVEIFIKSYLYTQNLPCSRLWIWLDADRNPTAMKDMLQTDPVFAAYLPLVERGDIVLKSWKFPSRIPLPGIADNTDGLGYYKTPGPPNSDGERLVADGVIEDAEGQQWLTLTPKQMTFLPVAVSDAVRFVVLHLHGGLYLDMDVILLRDMRPLLLPDPKTGTHAFAERWGAHPHPGDYNTAIMSLTANSSLSSYLLRGGVRMGLNFHPMVIGRMAWKDERNEEFLMLETAAVDPLWTEFDSSRVGKCTVPCFKNYGEAFIGKAGAVPGEWKSYEEEEETSSRNGAVVVSRAERKDEEDGGDGRNEDDQLESRSVDMDLRRKRRRRRRLRIGGDSDAASSSTTRKPENNVVVDEEEAPLLSLSTTQHQRESHSPSLPEDLESRLRSLGVIKDYRIEEDQYPPNNRTLQNFYRGAWTYHIHNQWLKHPQPSSWFDVIQHAHNGFFQSKRSNPYGERWSGPRLANYERWVEYL